MFGNWIKSKTTVGGCAVDSVAAQLQAVKKAIKSMFTMMFTWILLCLCPPSKNFSPPLFECKLSNMQQLLHWFYSVKNGLFCIPEEIEFVWQSHWGFGKFLYLASRYLAFIDTPMRIAYYLTPNPDIKFCSTTNTISGWFY
ncbi:hypothetical protein K439DRAFT_1165871 [Ramaria rubella]|nr:hypothetical protein K439DRAFT_1165871 [Ramaria rubella]